MAHLRPIAVHAIDDIGRRVHQSAEPLLADAQGILGRAAGRDILEKNGHLSACRRLDAKRGKLQPAPRLLELLLETDRRAGLQDRPVEIDPPFGLARHQVAHALSHHSGDAGVDRKSRVGLDVHVIVERATRSVQELDDAEAFVDGIEKRGVTLLRVGRIPLGAHALYVRPGAIGDVTDERHFLGAPGVSLRMMNRHQRFEAPLFHEGHAHGGADANGLERRRFVWRKLDAVIPDHQRFTGAQALHRIRAEVAEAIAADNAFDTGCGPVSADRETVLVGIHVGVGAQRSVEIPSRYLGGAGEHVLGFDAHLCRALQIVEESAARHVLLQSTLGQCAFGDVCRLDEDAVDVARFVLERLIYEIDDARFALTVAIEGHSRAVTDVRLSARIDTIEQIHKALLNHFRQGVLYAAPMTSLRPPINSRYALLTTSKR